ncbi:YbaY family lipoprotein [Cobetia sp. QF-1]|uniref:YbaY family lipoprotein n=1 Tax=Cobetia sp. QF-1 TaxID=1969833 RepID=UPI000B540B27|nr:YbaY family lipoprotein [Cobetia sp. QF-1]
MPHSDTQRLSRSVRNAAPTRAISIISARAVTLTALLVGVLGLSGCMTGPDFTQLEARVVPQKTFSAPADAQLEVRLVDVSKADAPAGLIASTRYGGLRQGPFPVSLQYDRNAIEEGHRYALQADVRSEGQLYWINDTAVPVLGADSTSEREVEIPLVPLPRALGH